jgi:hypothetical protein
MYHDVTADDDMSYVNWLLMYYIYMCREFH